MSGFLAGSFFFGLLGDKIGRRWALLAAMLTAIGGGLGGSFVDHYEWYCVTRFFTGAGKNKVIDFIIPFFNVSTPIRWHGRYAAGLCDGCGACRHKDKDYCWDQC